MQDCHQVGKHQHRKIYVSVHLNHEHTIWLRCWLTEIPEKATLPHYCSDVRTYIGTVKHDYLMFTTQIMMKGWKVNKHSYFDQSWIRGRVPKFILVKKQSVCLALWMTHLKMACWYETPRHFDILWRMYSADIYKDQLVVVYWYDVNPCSLVILK